jgi:hypothetical protein
MMDRGSEGMIKIEIEKWKKKSYPLGRTKDPMVRV